MTRACAAAMLVLASSIARADGDPKAAADALVLEGNKLGAAGDPEGAIAKFKQADRLYPRHIHDCNIGLGYARLERWPQALFFLERCRSRATDALPEWVERRSAQLTAKLKQGAFAPVDVVARPDGAVVTVSAYASDEKLTSTSLIWLPFGRHQLRATLAGHLDREIEIEISDRERQRVELELEVRPAPVAPKPEPQPELPPPPRFGKLPWIAAGASAALAIGGIVLHAAAISVKREAERLDPGPEFEERRGRFRDLRGATLVCYALAAAGAGVTFYLFSRRRAAITTAVDRRSASVGVAWSWR